MKCIRIGMFFFSPVSTTNRMISRRTVHVRRNETIRMYVDRSPDKSRTFGARDDNNIVSTETNVYLSAVDTASKRDVMETSAG